MVKKTEEEKVAEQMEVEPTVSEPSAKSKRVRVRNTISSNGKLGAIANPLREDVDKWLAKGWVRD